MAALIAALQMAAQRGCATAFDGMQYTLLSHRQRLGVCLAKLLAMGAHDVGDFQRRPHEQRPPTVGNPGRGKGVNPTDW